MKRIELTPAELLAQSAEMSALASDYESLFGNVSRTLTTLNTYWSANLSNNFSSKIASAQRSFSGIVEMMEAGAEAAKTSAETFESLDSQLARYMDGSGNGISGDNVSADWRNNNDSQINWWSWSDTWKVVGTAGIIGSAISLIGGVLTGGGPVKTGLSAAKGTAKLTENIFKAVPKSGASFDWKTLIGMTQKTLEDSPHSFAEAWSENIGKFSFSNAETVTGKIAVGAKWAGSALTVFTTGYDNYKEFKDSGDWGRMAAETAIESGVKIVGGIAVSSAVSWGITMGLTALGCTVGAPAIVVGLAAVGITWGINRLSEAVFGKRAAEAVSDLVIDKIVPDVIVKAKAIGDAVSTAGKAISGWWNNRFGRVFA